MQFRQIVTAFSKTALNSPELIPIIIRPVKRKKRRMDNLRLVILFMELYRIMFFLKKIKINFNLDYSRVKFAPLLFILEFF